MNAIYDEINKQLTKINKKLPSGMSDQHANKEQIELALKSFKSKIIQIKIRNISIVLLIGAVAALFLGPQYYWHCGLGSAILFAIVTNPSAKRAKIITNAEHKLFLLDLIALEPVHNISEDIEPSPEDNTDDDLLIGAH